MASRTGAHSAERKAAMGELRALAHPLRLRLIECFTTPRTTMQVAELLGEPPTRLYHHVNILQRAGMLRLKKTRQVRGTTEKYYEVTRHRFGMIRRGALSTSRPAIRGLTATVFDEARAEVLAALANPGSITRENAPIALRMLLGVPPSRQKRVRRIIMSTIKKIQREVAGHHEESQRWALTLSFAPTARKTSRR